VVDQPSELSSLGRLTGQQGLDRVQLRRTNSDRQPVLAQEFPT
jgi:hypothetical protein